MQDCPESIRSRCDFVKLAADFLADPEGVGGQLAALSVKFDIARPPFSDSDRRAEVPSTISQAIHLLASHDLNSADAMLDELVKRDIDRDDQSGLELLIELRGARVFPEKVLERLKLRRDSNQEDELGRATKVLTEISKVDLDLSMRWLDVIGESAGDHPHYLRLFGRRVFEERGVEEMERYFEARSVSSTDRQKLVMEIMESSHLALDEEGVSQLRKYVYNSEDLSSFDQIKEKLFSGFENGATQLLDEYDDEFLEGSLPVGTYLPGRRHALRLSRSDLERGMLTYMFVGVGREIRRVYDQLGSHWLPRSLSD